MPRIKLTRLVGALAVWCAFVGIAAGDPKKDRAAVTKLEELYHPTASLSGEARTMRACADAATLQTADAAFSDEKAPAGASINNAGWRDLATSVESDLSALVEVCKAPDKKRKLPTNVQTADEIITELDTDLRALFDAAKKRVVPRALATFQKTLAAAKVPSKSFCAQATKLAKQATEFAEPPKGVDAMVWHTAYEPVRAGAAGLKCGKTAEPDEVNASALEDLRGKVNKLVATIPAT